MPRRFTLDYESPDWPVFPRPQPRPPRPPESAVTRVGQWVTLAFAVALTFLGLKGLGVPRWHELRPADALAFAAVALVGLVVGMITILRDHHERALLAAVGVLANLFLALTALLVLACRLAS